MNNKLGVYLRFFVSMYIIYTDARSDSSCMWAAYHVASLSGMHVCALDYGVKMTTANTMYGVLFNVM